MTCPRSHSLAVAELSIGLLTSEAGLSPPHLSPSLTCRLKDSFFALAGPGASWLRRSVEKKKIESSKCLWENGRLKRVRDDTRENALHPSFGQACCPHLASFSPPPSPERGEPLPLHSQEAEVRKD